MFRTAVCADRCYSGDITSLTGRSGAYFCLIFVQNIVDDLILLLFCLIGTELITFTVLRVLREYKNHCVNPDSRVSAFIALIIN